MTTAKTTDAPAPDPTNDDSWIPAEPGDSLSGVVEDIDVAHSDFRMQRDSVGSYPLLWVRTDDGVLLKWHAFGTVDYNEVAKHMPQPGERIIITYHGLGKAKAGQNAPKLVRIRMPDRDPRKAAARAYAQLFGPQVAADRAAAAIEREFGATDVTDAPDEQMALDGSDHPFND